LGYSPERKLAVLERMLPPNNVTIRQLSHEEVISEVTLHKWRAEARGKGQLMPDANAGSEGWSSRYKFTAVLETAALNEHGLGEYCRIRLIRGNIWAQNPASTVSCAQRAKASSGTCQARRSSANRPPVIRQAGPARSGPGTSHGCPNPSGECSSTLTSSWTSSAGRSWAGWFMSESVQNWQPSSSDKWSWLRDASHARWFCTPTKAAL
jgi:hypothetical protein